MISYFGQGPCRFLANLRPFTYLYRDYILVEAFYFEAISKKVRSIGGSKIRL